jgi:hypothetical protein
VSAEPDEIQRRERAARELREAPAAVDRAEIDGEESAASTS